MQKRGSSIFLPLAVLLLVSMACSMPIATSPTAAPTVQQDAPTVAAPTDAPTVAPTVEPSITPTQAPTTPPGVLVSANGITFYYDPSLAGGVTVSIQEDVPYSDELPMWEATPQQDVFTFENYLFSDHFHTPRIRVFDLMDYANRMNYPAMVDEANTLISIIQNRDMGYTGEIPTFPVWPAAQMIVSNLNYVDFNGGSGVRFLSQYAQAAYPINNGDIIYLYEGITSDHRWYIQAVFPIHNPILQNDDSPIPGGDYEAFVSEPNYSNYIAGIESQLSAQADNTFTPSLALLDALVRSITISK